MQQRLTTADRLLATLGSVGRIRHLRILQRVMVDVQGGSQALSEVDFVRFCQRHDLPTPARQRVRRDQHGRRRYLDAEFTRRDGSTFAVEIDGAIHLLVGTYWDDCYRGNELVIAGDSLLRFPSVAVHIAPAVVVSQLRRMLGPR